MADPSRGEFVKAGYLIKSPPDFKAKVAQWHRRWFLLMDSKLVYPLASRYVRLEYYQSEAEAKRLADPKGIINLNTCTQIANREPIKGHRFVFDIVTDERVYHLVAESGEDKQNWVDTLNTLLFTTSRNLSPGRQRKWSPPEQLSEVTLRARTDSSRLQRPLSYTGVPSPKSVHQPVFARPLPPVPNGNVRTTQKKPRPLPPPPTSPKPKFDGQNIFKDSSTSPMVKKRRKPPPPKPAPYKGGATSSGRAATPTGTSPVIDISEHYEVAPGLMPITVKPRPSPGARRKIPTSRSLDDDVLKSNSTDADYSVLQSTNVPGFDSSDAVYSHLEDTPPPLRHSKSSPVAARSKGIHSSVISDDNDYSLLQH